MSAPDPSLRTQPTVVLTADEPAIVDGVPVLPQYWAKTPASATLIQGAGHIHAIADPNPIWNPFTGGWTHPPPPGPTWAARWTVDDLPDPSPYPNGYYWLGDPSAADGTLGQDPRTHAWTPNGSTPHAPLWRSFFPFKPSVTAIDHFLQGGGIVHHPKGVNFNSHFIEHMWMDWGRPQYQPYTWLIACCVASWPTPDYTHYILDAGRNPDDMHFPRLSASQCGTPRQINDDVAYRNLLSVSPGEIRATTHLGDSATNMVRTRNDASLHPRMYFVQFDGSKSSCGAYGPGVRFRGSGTVGGGISDQGRFYVLGRRNGWIAQDYASHLLVFEIRYFRSALSSADLLAQYSQLDSTYQFNRY